MYLFIWWQRGRCKWKVMSQPNALNSVIRLSVELFFSSSFVCTCTHRGSTHTTANSRKKRGDQSVNKNELHMFQFLLHSFYHLYLCVQRERERQINNIIRPICKCTNFGLYNFTGYECCTLPNNKWIMYLTDVFVISISLTFYIFIL